MWWRGGALTLTVKDEAKGVTVVLCSQSDRVIVTSTPHNFLHPERSGGEREDIRRGEYRNKMEKVERECNTGRGIGVEVGIRWRGWVKADRRKRETYVARLIPRVTFLSQRYGSNPSELSSMLTRLT